MRFMHGGVWRVCIIVCPLLALISMGVAELHFEVLDLIGLVNFY